MSDDEEFSISHSSADYLESPEKERLKALQRELQKKGIKVDADKQNDLNELKLALLRGQVADDQDSNTDDQQTPLTKAMDIGTKTREQEIAAAKLTAETQASADQQVVQNNADDKRDEQLKENEVQNENS